MDSANDPMTPPAHLGISRWSDWYPCPGTRLEMMWKVLKYAKDKGLKCVTCAEGFETMGNKASAGYFNDGLRFGMDRYAGLWDTDSVYPHYVVSATDEVSYYNPLIVEDLTIEIDSLSAVKRPGRFLISDSWVVWSTPDPTGISIEVWDMTGRKVTSSSENSVKLEPRHGVYMVCAVSMGEVLGTVKVVR